MSYSTIYSKLKKWSRSSRRSTTKYEAEVCRRGKISNARTPMTTRFHLLFPVTIVITDLAVNKPVFLYHRSIDFLIGNAFCQIVNKLKYRQKQLVDFLDHAIKQLAGMIRMSVFMISARRYTYQISVPVQLFPLRLLTSQFEITSSSPTFSDNNQEIAKTKLLHCLECNWKFS